jgi:hypothetical protein
VVVGGIYASVWQCTKRDATTPHAKCQSVNAKRMYHVQNGQSGRINKANSTWTVVRLDPTNQIPFNAYSSAHSHQCSAKASSMRKLYHPIAMGTVARCHREWASKTLQTGGKSNNSSMVARVVKIAYKAGRDPRRYGNRGREKYIQRILCVNPTTALESVLNE